MKKKGGSNEYYDNTEVHDLDEDETLDVEEKNNQTLEEDEQNFEVD